MKLSKPFVYRYLLISLAPLLFSCTNTITTFQPEQYHDERKPDLYIWPNSNNYSNNEASLRLIVKVGSLQEEDGELGHAHFVEHLAFNGTKKFPGTALIERMRELDLEIGQHSNAYTTFDHTSYQIDLNSVDEERLDSAMELLAEWSYNIDFTAAQIEQERLIIIEEWRQGETTDKRTDDVFFEDYYSGTHFLERQPIGTRSDIEGATSSSLQDFYQHWYQPHNQAVIVAGDIDSETVRAAFERHFPVRPSDGPQPQIHYASPENMSDFLAVSDDYATQGYIDLSFFSETKMPQTSEQLVEFQAWQAAMDIWQQRAMKQVEQSGGSITNVDYQWDFITPNQLMIQLYANLSRNDFQQALNILEGERLRLLRDSIQASELDHWRRGFLADNRRQQDSADFLADIMTDHYLYNFPMMGQVEAIERFEQTIPKLTPTAVRDALAERMENSPKLNLVYPVGTPKPETNQMQAWLNNIEISPSTDINSSPQPEEAWPIATDQPGEILEERELANGIIEWTLANGITVIYQYSDENPKEFSYELFGLGGLNYLDAADARVA